MNIRVNGESKELADGLTLSQLLDGLGLGPKWVVVERNGHALLPSELASAGLADGDVLEIVRAVAGG